MKYYVYAKQIVLDDQVIDKAYLTIEDGKFGPILMEEPQDAPIKDYSNSVVAPGLVDTHMVTSLMMSWIMTLRALR